MRPLALLALALVLSGCLAQPPAGVVDGEPVSSGCPTPVDAPTRGGRAVQVQAANTMATPSCVRVRFDRVLVAASDLPAEDAGLRADPRPIGDFRWETVDALVRVEDDATGRVHESRVSLPPTAYVVAWVDETAIRIEVYGKPPSWA